MIRTSRDLRALFGLILLGAASSATGCVCPGPRGHVQWVPMPPSGDGAAAFAIDCEHACGTTDGCVRKVYADGTPGIECGGIDPPSSCGMGRRPMGLSGARKRPSRGSRPRRSTRRDEAKLLAEFAMLECASVRAFDELAEHLARHAAPKRLVERARGAAVEESRHARSMLRLARRAGARRRPIRVVEAPAPTLAELAIANAVEGCVLETFGALLTHHQAVAATDRRFREAVAVIAEEEASHAILARDIDRWVRSVLPAVDVVALDRAHEEAWRALLRPTRAPASTRLGLPAGEERVRLAAMLASALA